MHRPKGVVFDLGNVLLRFDYGIACRKMRLHSSLTEEELLPLLNQSPLLLKYESGQCDTAQFFAEVQRQARFRGSLTDFEPIFADIFEVIPEMVQLHRAIHNLGISTWLFSNTNEMAMRHIRQVYPFVNEFSGQILSYKHGGIKPQPAVYKVVERVSGLSGPDLLYIDDRLENVEGAHPFGWQTIHHTDPRQTIAEVSKRLGAKFTAEGVVP
jgi:FMN phosphatase YigB (HAD superfamily)